MHAVVPCINLGRKKAFVKTSPSFREMSPITSLLQSTSLIPELKYRTVSSVEVSPCVDDSTGHYSLAIAYVGPLRDSVSPGLFGRRAVRSLPTKDRFPMGMQSSSREVRPISTSQRERGEHLHRGPRVDGLTGSQFFFVSGI
jgi:hypothetical protein